MRAFVDTSAFYALLDADDANHRAAKRAWAGLLGAGEVPATSNYVLVETFALVQQRLGLPAVRAFQEDVVPLLDVEFVSADLHRAGVAALLSAARRSLSLVDCISFECMRVAGIRSAFSFDRHFREQGFVLIP